MITVIIKNEDIESSIIGQSEEFSEVIQLVKQALLGFGFAPQTVECWFENEEKVDD